MKYVLDASVAIKWVIVEPDSNKATRLRPRSTNQFPKLLNRNTNSILAGSNRAGSRCPVQRILI